MVVPQAALDAWLERIERLHPRGIQLGLDRVGEVARRLFGTPSPRPAPLTFVVGGTNGKGSACAMLEAILVAAGYRCGCYTSPHLLRFNERIRVDGIEASDERLVAAFERVEAARTAVSDPARAPTALTYFEFTTLAALELFAHEALDVAVLEVGLGGRLDAVNLVDADCAVLMMIDLDHREWLGETREAIGAEKAPIMRAGRPAVIADPDPPASVLAHAAAIGADLWRYPADFRYETFERQWTWYGPQRRQGGLAHPAIRGANQLLNAATVLAALDRVRDRLPMPAQAIRQGLSRVSLPGRFQVLPGQPAVVLDVGHNPQAAVHLARNLDDMGFYPQTFAVFGMLGDKDVAAVVRAMARSVDHWICCDLPGPRGLSGQALSVIVREALEARRREGFRPGDEAATVAVAPTPGEALARALGLAQPTDRIVVFGSFLTVSDVQRTLAAATTGNATPP